MIWLLCPWTSNNISWQESVGLYCSNSTLVTTNLHLAWMCMVLFVWITFSHRWPETRWYWRTSLLPFGAAAKPSACSKLSASTISLVKFVYITAIVNFMAKKTRYISQRIQGERKNQALQGKPHQSLLRTAILLSIYISPPLSHAQNTISSPPPTSAQPQPNFPVPFLRIRKCILITMERVCWSLDMYTRGNIRIPQHLHLVQSLRVH